MTKSRCTAFENAQRLFNYEVHAKRYKKPKLHKIVTDTRLDVGRVAKEIASDMEKVEKE